MIAVLRIHSGQDDILALITIMFYRIRIRKLNNKNLKLKKNLLKFNFPKKKIVQTLLYPFIYFDHKSQEIGIYLLLFVQLNNKKRKKKEKKKTPPSYHKQKTTPSSSTYNIITSSYNHYIIARIIHSNKYIDYMRITLAFLVAISSPLLLHHPLF